MSEKKINGAEALIMSLERCGIEMTFGIPGGAAIPLYVGGAAVVTVTVGRVHWSFRPREVHRGELRRFLTFSSGLFAIAASESSVLPA